MASLDLKVVEEIISKKISDFIGEEYKLSTKLSCEVEDFAFQFRNDEHENLNQMVAEDAYLKFFNMDGYSPEDIFYLKDEDNDPTMYGWVMTPDGKIHHCTQQYCHGVVLASLFPKDAFRLGYAPPPMKKSNSIFTIHGYQDFMFLLDDDIPIITFGCSGYDRVSWNYQLVTEAQYKSLKAWLTKNRDLEDKVDTTYNCESTFKKLLISIDTAVNSRKMSGIGQTDYTLKQPDSDGLGD